MAKLTSTQRKNLSSSQFAIPAKKPGSGSYPIPDKSHARNALARVSQHGTPSEKAQVRAKVKMRFPDIGAPDKESIDKWMERRKKQLTLKKVAK